MWSNVRGIDAGLLPTEEQLADLEKALEKAKQKWIELGLSTEQPKWHITFYHLLEQVRRYGGLADKADDTIEHMHQILQRLRDQFRRVRSYQQRETGIKKALRRYRHPDIVQVMEEFAEKKRRKNPTKRQLEAAEKDAQERARKTKKRRLLASAWC